MRRVAIYGSRQQEGHIDEICNLIEALLKEKAFISIEKKLASVLFEAGFRPAVHGVKVCAELPHDTDVVISVGGDGTFLRTAKWLRGKEIPIVGINTGHLGFLAENSTNDIPSLVNLILKGEASVEKRLVLQVECDGLPATDWPYALNEAAFLKGAASMIDVDISVDGFHLATYRSDGLLIATPTGSTAYNLSVGGPIVAPTLQCMILSPIAPHTLTLRPIVIGADSVIEATVISRASDFRLSIDGRAASIPCSSRVKIKKASHDVLTLRKPGENFASTLRSKFLWGQGWS